jgi:hypothetical protein
MLASSSNAAPAAGGEFMGAGGLPHDAGAGHLVVAVSR